MELGYVYTDFPEAQYGFQDSASPIMEGAVDFHNDIVAFLLVILTLVVWVLSANIFLHSGQRPNFERTGRLDTEVYTGLVNFFSKDSDKDLSAQVRRARVIAHHDSLEVVWTSIPAFIMLCIALPSFALLYSMDEIVGSAVTLKAVGHQWYWHYEYNTDESDGANVGTGARGSETGGNVPPKWVFYPPELSLRDVSPSPFRWFIDHGYIRQEPIVVQEAMRWINGWFSKFENWADTHDYSTREQRELDLYMHKHKIPGPQTLGFFELCEFEYRIQGTFETLRFGGVRQSEVPERVGEALGPQIMSDVLVADRAAWKSLCAFFEEWAKSVDSKSRPGSGGTRSTSVSPFDSYMALMEEAPRHLRLLAVDRPVVLPTQTHVRVLVTAADVLHSWAVPSLGIKLDACPGRLNQASLFIRRVGDFYGQCSEICGVNHGFMPIHVRAVDEHEFWNFIRDRGLRCAYVASLSSPRTA